MATSRLLVPSSLARRTTSLLRPAIRRALATPANSLIRPTQTTTLGNGLSVATEYSPYLQTATVGIWIDAGSRAETDATSGTAHFLEHLAFKVHPRRQSILTQGTSSRNQTQLELEIENMGAHLNAYTAREQTVYYARCFKQDAPACVDIIADILQNSKFEESAIEREREVILREQEEVDKQFEEVVFDHLHTTAFPGQDLGRTILGPKENILSIKRQDLVEYISKNYRADRMVLVSAGGVPHDDVVALAEKHFGKIPPSGSYTSSGESQKAKPRFVGSEVRIRDDTMQHAHIALAVEGVGHKHPDYWTMLVMQAIVGNWDRALGSAPHLGSRLSSIVAKNGLANSFMSFSTSYSDTGLWGIYFVTENRVQIDDLIHFCLRVLRYRIG
jgi:mitochondrial-processing peptidase subunit beta